MFWIMSSNKKDWFQIIDSYGNFIEKMSTFVVRSVAADGVAPLGVRTFAVCLFIYALPAVLTLNMLNCFKDYRRMI